MNKFVIIGLAVLIIVAVGVAYAYLKPASDKPVVTGAIREITVRAVKNEWRFEPEEIEAVLGDKIVMTVINEDDYDHGLGLDAFGISQRLPANSTTVIDFVVSRPGEFPFYCSVPCGEGEVNGVHRDHYSMTGALRVKDLVTERR